MASGIQNVAAAMQKRAAPAPFMWGANGEQLSPEQVKSRRERAENMRHPAGYTPKGWFSLLGALAQEGVGKYKEDEADRAEKTGHAKVAEALKAARESGDYMSVMGDEWATPQQSAVAQALQSRAWSQEDQAKAWAREDSRAAVARALAAQQAAKPDYAFEFAPDGSLIRIDKNAGQIESLGTYAKPEPPPDPFTLGENDTRFSGDGTVLATGAPKTPDTVINNNVGGTDDFYKKLDTDAGAQQAALIDAGRNAASNNVRLQQVQSLLQSAPQGASGALTQFAGNLGIPVEGLDEVQAAQALINQMVPGQRPPGSGTMSDADLALFKQSLPAIINQPGGNQKIIETTLAINDYTMKQAAIAEKVANREISPAEGRALQSQIPNPLAVTAPAPVPTDVDPSLWEMMTPEERALWQN
jgi:hypothetical protein